MWRLRLRRWNRRRKRQLDSALLSYWDLPLPDPRHDWRQCDYLVCDAEMSGLDPREAELLSLGWVAIHRGEIDLASADHRLIQNAESVGQSAAIHQLRDCELRQGEPLREVIMTLLAAARGRTLVFHHAPIDLAFLDRACREVLGAPFLAPVADTLAIERLRMARANHVPAQGELRLQSCRERYGMPPHKAHNALSDAMATAELLLAQCAMRGEGLTLGDLLAG